MHHQYKLNGYNIVLDTCSGSVHLVDDVAYDIIAMYSQHTPEEICRSVGEKYAGPAGCDGRGDPKVHCRRGGAEGPA